jgi:putative transposase
MRCTLLESNYEPDHVHLWVETHPALSISKLVNALKGVSARWLRSERFPEVTSKLWGEYFWSPSYCAVSCGGAPLEIIRQYVEQQRGEGTTSVQAAPPRPEG